MPEKSLFSLLTRSPCWISFLIFAFLYGLSYLEILEKFRILLILLSLSFVLTGFISLWKRRNLPSAARVEKTVGEVLAMSRKDFFALIEEAFRREAYEVRQGRGPADFELAKNGRLTLVNCRRWKAASHGQEVLRELVATRDAGKAQEVRYVCINAPSENAEEYARQYKVHLMRGPEIAQLLRLPKKKRE
ncbi:MAG: restriction endonuclease [Candidatus Accumulibacter sp.]|jgi:restriction system protein|nr:restriction endonuclease [Accumulibacter sp.]